MLHHGPSPVVFPVVREFYPLYDLAVTPAPAQRALQIAAALLQPIVGGIILHEPQYRPTSADPDIPIYPAKAAVPPEAGKHVVLFTARPLFYADPTGVRRKVDGLSLFARSTQPGQEGEIESSQTFITLREDFIVPSPERIFVTAHDITHSLGRVGHCMADCIMRGEIRSPETQARVLQSEKPFCDPCIDILQSNAPNLRRNYERYRNR